jgi:Ca2+-binding RTX toxin-like protein
MAAQWFSPLARWFHLFKASAWDLAPPATSWSSSNDGYGIDTIFTAGSYALQPNEENVVHLGTANTWSLGNGLANSITGNSGLNIMFGGDGNDTLNGAEGNDILIGGSGADKFLFAAAPGAANGDRILDFTSGTDQVVVDGLVHADTGPSGALTASDGRFWAASGAVSGHDEDDRIIYNTDSGDLWYDADGSGDGAAQLIATLHGAPALAATDIAIVNGRFPQLHLVGTADNDTLTGGAGDDTLEGMGGDDSLVGAAGLDSLLGGDGNDTLDGTDGAGLYGVDTLSGGAGDDLLLGGLHYELWGGDGNDTLQGGTSDVMLEGIVYERVHGGAGDDLLIAGRTYGSVIFMEADEGNDVLIADVGGLAFGFSMNAGEGDDSLYGGNSGSMYGGRGADSFFFTESLEYPAMQYSNIEDFQSGVDKIVLEASAFADIGVPGNFAENDPRFRAVESGDLLAQDTDDRIIHFIPTGDLYYDPDGSGEAAARLIVKLQAWASFGAPDITMI